MAFVTDGPLDMHLWIKIQYILFWFGLRLFEVNRETLLLCVGCSCVGGLVFWAKVASQPLQHNTTGALSNSNAESNLKKIPFYNCIQRSICLIVLLLSG